MVLRLFPIIARRTWRATGHPLFPGAPCRLLSGKAVARRFVGHCVPSVISPWDRLCQLACFFALSDATWSLVSSWLLQSHQVLIQEKLGWLSQLARPTIMSIELPVSRNEKRWACLVPRGVLARDFLPALSVSACSSTATLTVFLFLCEYETTRSFTLSSFSSCLIFFRPLSQALVRKFLFL